MKHLKEYITEKLKINKDTSSHVSKDNFLDILFPREKHSEMWKNSYCEELVENCDSFGDYKTINIHATFCFEDEMKIKATWVWDGQAIDDARTSEFTIHDSMPIEFSKGGKIIEVFKETEDRNLFKACEKYLILNKILDGLEYYSQIEEPLKRGDNDWPLQYTDYDV